MVVAINHTFAIIVWSVPVNRVAKKVLGSKHFFLKKRSKKTFVNLDRTGGTSGGQVQQRARFLKTLA
jgi:hypothetical protein